MSRKLNRSHSDHRTDTHPQRHTFNTRLMEAGVLQEMRMALMGHVNPQQVHAIHIELPVKRESIAKLEDWAQAQRREELE